MADSAKAKKNPSVKTSAPKVIFVVGGVMSGVGKGVAASSIALLLQARGLKVTALKIDPYINVDAGTMDPTEHGEAFVLSEGLETDQDMGNYERFLNLDLPNINYMTTGRVYQAVIEKERRGGYKGRNVQVVPDIPEEAIRRIKMAAQQAEADVAVVEIGGTIGEYENVLFLETIRLLKHREPDNVAVVMVSYLPVPGSIGEMKTKPTQHAARTLGSAGVQADIIIARSNVAIDKKRKEKISNFCNVSLEHVIAAPDVASIYDIPVNFEKDKLSANLMELLKLPVTKAVNLRAWKNFLLSREQATGTVRVAVIGKHFSSGDFVLSDVYLSVLEALKFSAAKLGVTCEVEYLPASDFTSKKGLERLDNYQGVLIPSSFGKEGVEGELAVITYLREQQIPFLGIGFGMQLAVIEFARRLLGLKKATSAEIDPKAIELVIEPIADIPEHHMEGRWIRLGSHEIDLIKESVVGEAYNKATIQERHRHSFAVNHDYLEALQEKGLVVSATSTAGESMIVEAVELPKHQHPFFVGTQFQPELQARPLVPNPLVTAFLAAALAKKRE